MPKPRRLPYFVVEANVGENPKLAGLPSDEARLGYFYACLGRGKLQRPQGQFAGRSHWRDVAGRFARHLGRYLAAGLMHEAPFACAQCAKDWGELPKGTLVVHNFLRHQIDPWAAERAEAWRTTNADQPPNARGLSGDRTANARGLNGDRTPASPARARDRVSAPHVETVRHRDGETESLRERSEEIRSSSREAERERNDVAALLDRGWKQVTPGQRAVLDEVLDHHTDTGPEWAAAIIRATPAEEDPLAAVMTAERERLRSERERVDREDAAWRETKAREAREAKEAYERLFASQP